jgi:hypothetical protein
VEALAQVGSAGVRVALLQLYDVLDQTLVSQLAAQRLMLQGAKSLPEVALFEAVPRMGPIGSCRRERLPPDAAPLQQRAEAPALLPPRRQPPQQRRQADRTPASGARRVRVARRT